MDVWDPWFDRGRPAFAPYAPALESFRGRATWPPLEAWGASLPAGLLSAGGAPIRFVQQPPRRRRGARVDSCVELGRLYDERIYVRGEVPSRARSWHDFFNMLAWCTFPRTKRAINARQRAALLAHVDVAAPRLPSARTREQDALAMLDEGGLVVATHPSATALAAAIDEGDSDRLAAAVAAGQARAFLLGHAILEHLVTRPGAVRAMVFPVELATLQGPGVVRAVDEAVEQTLVRLRSPPAAKGMPVVEPLFAG